MSKKPNACGHGCVIAKCEGMGTNGGCHCLSHRTFDMEDEIRAKKAIAYYRAELVAEKARADKYAEALRECSDIANKAAMKTSSPVVALQRVIDVINKLDRNEVAK